jgi:hypothetical protein
VDILSMLNVSWVWNVMKKAGDTGPTTLIEVIFHQIGQLELSDS